MYRPTVRYDDVYRVYVDDVFRATTLDRNQIIRLALFLLPHSEKGIEILSEYLKKDASLPSPHWTVNQRWLWTERRGKQALEGGTSAKDVRLVNFERGEGRHEDSARYSRTLSRRKGTIREGRTDDGTIRIIVG